MKQVLVTGANRGIGFETAKQLLEQGFKVFIGSRNLQDGTAAEQQLKNEGFENVKAIQIDITSEESVQKAKEDIAKHTAALDILINNAGINGGSEPYTVLEANSEEYLNAFQTNMVGTARVTRHFLDFLRKSEAPRIVNVSTSVGSLSLQSDPAWLAYHFGKYGVYAISKAALNMYTVNLDYELRDTPFKVNAVCPGLTATDFTAFNGGEVSVAAKRIIKYALIGENGPSGKFFSEESNPETGEIPW